MKSERNGRKWSIVVSVLSIICCVSLIAGATFALFTDRQENEVSFSSGNMNLSGTIALKSTWYVTSESGDPEKTPADGTQAEFGGGGTVSVSGEGEGFTVAMTNIAPGEGADFALKVTNLGNIKAKFSVYLQSNGFDLTVLAVENLDTQTPAGMQGDRLVITENWQEVAGGADQTVNFSIGLPYGYEGARLDGSFAIVIDGYQYNASTEVTIDDEPVNSLQEALKRAAAGEKTDYVIDVGIGNHTLSEVVDLNGKNITLRGNGEEDSVIDGGLALSGGSLTLENATLSGDITGSGALSMANVSVNGSVNVAGETSRQISLFSANSALPEIKLDHVTITAETNAAPAIFVTGAKLSLSSSEVNFTTSVGPASVGAVQVSGGEVAVENSTITAHGVAASSSSNTVGINALAGSTVTVSDTAITVTEEYAETRPGYAGFPHSFEVAVRLTENSTGVLTNCEMNAGMGNIVFHGSSVTMNGGSLTGIYYGFSGNNTVGAGNIALNGAKVTVSEGTAIYVPMQGEINIQNSTLSGEAALEARLGHITIANSALTATAEYKDAYDAEGNGARPNGSAILLNGNKGAYMDGFTDDYSMSLTLCENVTLSVADERAAKVSYYDWGAEGSLAPQEVTITGVAEEDLRTYIAGANAVTRMLNTYPSVYLNSDLSVSGNYLVNFSDGQEAKHVTLDLNGHTLTAEYVYSSFVGGGSSLTVKNGAMNIDLTSTDPAAIAICVLSAGADGTVVLDNVDLKSEKNSGLYTQGKNATLVVKNNSTVTANVWCVGTNASTDKETGEPLYDDVHITLTDSEFYGVSSTGDNCPIGLNVPGDMTIENCKIVGQRQALLVRGGNVSVKNTTIELNGTYGTKDEFLSGNWGSGNNLPMAAIVLGNRSASAYRYPATLTLQGVSVTVTGEGNETVPEIYAYAQEEDYRAKIIIADDTETTVKNAFGTLIAAGGAVYAGETALNGTYEFQDGAFVEQV